MRNQKYFETISKIHDQIQDNQILNLILGAYNQIAALEAKVNELEQKIFAAALKTGVGPLPNEDPALEPSTVPADSEVTEG